MDVLVRPAPRAGRLRRLRAAAARGLGPRRPRDHLGHPARRHRPRGRPAPRRRDAPARASSASATRSPRCGAALPTCTRTCWPCGPSARGRGVGLAPQVGAARGGPPPRPAPRHLDVRPDAARERPPQPPPPRAPWPASSCPTSTATTSSALHHGLATDRLLVRLGARQPARRRAGRRARRRPGRPGAAPRSTSVAWRDGLPVSSPPRLDLDATGAPPGVPADWDAVCRADPGLAREWQEVVRRAFECLFARGYAAVDCVSSATARPRALRPAPGRSRDRPTLEPSAGSSPVAAGSDGSDDHSLHEPA